VTSEDAFATFEHEGWERVADKYDSVWSSLTRQFIPSLLADARVTDGILVLDVACGPGYVSAAAKQLGAIPTGIDFSEKMVAIAKRTFQIRFTPSRHSLGRWAKTLKNVLAHHCAL